MANVYGYIRVSAADQNEARQVDAMVLAGIERDHLVIDKQSGKDFRRPGWRRLRRKLKGGDLVVVQSIDRLGRNYTEILEEWRGIVKGKGANIRVLDMPLLDTTHNTHGLIGQFVADIVLQILSFVAESERKSIRDRQRQGISSAKMRGVKFGRPRSPLPECFSDFADQVAERKLSSRTAASFCGMSRTTFWRAMKSHKKNKF